MARTAFCIDRFPEALVDNFQDHFALGGVACTFKKEIRPYESYTLQTRLLCWDEKWIYLQTRFYGSHGEQDIRAQSLAQYVLKRGRKTIKPEALFDTCGYDLSQAVLARNAESLAVAAAISKLGAHEPWQ